MNPKRERGDRGERCAAEYLQSQGYTVVSRNYRSRYGEIDIIAEGGGVLAFVEVKLRGSGRVARPAESVTYSKRQKIRATALCYLEETGSRLQPRFDVAEVFDEAGTLTIRYIENAFGETG